MLPTRRCEGFANFGQTFALKLELEGRTLDQNTAGSDIERVIATQEQIVARLNELAREIEKDYSGKDLLIIGVLKGAVMTLSDFALKLNRHIEIDWMAVSSYGSGTKSSGVVRILKDLDKDITGRNVVIVEDIVDTGITLSYLLKVVAQRKPATLRIATPPSPQNATVTYGTYVILSDHGTDVPLVFISNPVSPTTMQRSARTPWRSAARWTATRAMALRSSPSSL